MDERASSNVASMLIAAIVVVIMVAFILPAMGGPTPTLSDSEAELTERQKAEMEERFNLVTSTVAGLLVAVIGGLKLNGLVFTRLCDRRLSP